MGRLDFDSEGLLLLTDDGALQHRLSNPTFGHTRTYWVQVEGIGGPAALLQLEGASPFRATGRSLLKFGRSRNQCSRRAILRSAIEEKFRHRGSKSHCEKDAIDRFAA